MFVFAVVLAILMPCPFKKAWRNMLWRGNCRLSFDMAVIVHLGKGTFFLYPLIVCPLYLYLLPNSFLFHCTSLPFFVNPRFPTLNSLLLFFYVLVTFFLHIVLSNRKDISDCLLGKCFYLLDVCWIIHGLSLSMIVLFKIRGFHRFQYANWVILRAGKPWAWRRGKRLGNGYGELRFWMVNQYDLICEQDFIVD